MNARFRFLFAVTAFLPLASCEKPAPPAVSVTPEAAPYNAATESQLAEARDALQRQALDIETKTALMDKQLAEMEQALKDRENAELRDSLEALRQQNEALRAQADTARQQSNAVTQRIANTTPRVNVTPQVSAPRDHSLFYEQLAPYGRWMDVSGYGYCWRPTLTMARWKPYVDGCWVWSSMGWTWQSNEPFGWATYHYGRWVNLSRHGWVWVPGSEWAPAWVSWRQSRDHVGWAPLPPDRGSISGVYRDCDTQYNLGPSSYTFITTNHFVQPSYTTYCAPVTQNTTIFQSSVNVTQIVRCDDQPRRGMFQHHGGPPRAQMERDCARLVPQIQVQSIAANEIPWSRPGHRRPDSLVQPVMVELPLLSTDAPAMRPQMAERVDKPRPVDGFEGVPQRVATEIRETIAVEKLTAAVQQPVATPATVVSAPMVEPASSETVRPAMAIEDKPTLQAASPIAATQTSVIPEQPATPPAVIPVITAAAAPETTPSSTVVMPAEPGVPAPTVAVEATPPAVQPVPAEMPASQPSVVQTTPAVTETSVPQPNETPVQPPAAAEKMAVEQAAAAEAEKARMQAEATAMQQRQQEELAAQQRAMAEKATAVQALAAAEAERARQQAEANAMQQRQQEELAAQQRAMAENKAAELAQAAAEVERARQQAEAAAMQRQQEEAARRQAEAEMRRAQEAAERRAQEMARQQAEEQARRAAEEQMRQQQEMAQRQAEEQARRAAEEQMRRAQEEAQRAAQEAAEAAQRAADNAARNQPQTGG